MFSGNYWFLISIYHLVGSYWWVLIVAVLLVLGSKKLPELARGLGQSLGEFKGARDDFEREIHKPSTELEISATKTKEGSDQKPRR